MCRLCFSTEDVIKLKTCKHEICLKCLSVNDRKRCPIEDCHKSLHDIDLHRKKIYVRSLETIGRRHLQNVREKIEQS